MKTLSFILTTILISFSANVFAINTQPDSVVVAQSDRVDVMVLKFDKDQIGGEVVVVASNGDEVSKTAIRRKKMIIDFDQVKFGTYKIMVLVDGVEVAEFNYNKLLILSQIVR